jgi:hypothetical protein
MEGKAYAQRSLLQWQSNMKGSEQAGPSVSVGISTNTSQGQVHLIIAVCNSIAPDNFAIMSGAVLGRRDSDSRHQCGKHRGNRSGVRLEQYTGYIKPKLNKEYTTYCLY